MEVGWGGWGTLEEEVWKERGCDGRSICNQGMSTAEIPECKRVCFSLVSVRAKAAAHVENCVYGGDGTRTRKER